MRFRDFETFNQALLSKKGRLLQYPNSLVSRVLKAKYFPNASFFKASLRSVLSFTWRSIILVRKALKLRIQARVGNGCNIRLFRDPWLPRPHSFQPITRANKELDHPDILRIPLRREPYYDSKWNYSAKQAIGSLWREGRMWDHHVIARIKLDGPLFGVLMSQTKQTFSFRGIITKSFQHYTI
ncbi:LOW QUALITY PROTEIN: hypothetical protein TorRG33x02_169660 [Trema orientale]|uniref:Uncharacterized protein n=1 Tax=Trema orientale TaxID=63057 RepID=A0A2P5ENV8_TREOI|nr:LOW QUALITY PROTEIN: hypothetical protein TorRG33x02_169660 [Trema orientale]